MKLTQSWLAEFIELPTTDPQELVEAFESLGHEIEDWHVLEPTFEGVVVGKVLEVLAHPNADKVRLTKVDVGTEVLEIICGAWNFEGLSLCRGRSSEANSRSPVARFAVSRRTE